MDKNLAEIILESLLETCKYMKCQYCQNQNKKLVRIKVCGHYFCEDCSKKLLHENCLKCETFIEENDFDWNNIYVETEEIISNLVETLKNNESVNKNTNTNTLIYQNKTYEINFIEQQKVNAKGESQMHIACKKKKVTDVNNLLLKKVDINAQDFAGWTPIHEAIESGSEEIVEILLKNGALRDTPGEDYKTPLHKAVVCQNPSIVKLLLQYGANKDPIDYFGKKPIDDAKNVNKIEEIFKEDIEIIPIVTQLFCSKKMMAFCYYVEPEYKNKLKQNKIKILEEYNAKNVTHFIIRKTHKVSIKILTAMLEGCMIVPQEYIDDYLQDNFFIPIPEYTFINSLELNLGIQKAIMNDLLLLPKLFDGIYFYITDHHNHVVIYGIKVLKTNLIALINAGGGRVLHRAPTPSTCETKVNFPFHASKTNAKCCNYILFEEEKPPVLMYHMAELKHKSSKWLFDCALNFTILD